jgi:hypothetical protein
MRHIDAPQYGISSLDLMIREYQRKQIRDLRTNGNSPFCLSRLALFCNVKVHSRYSLHDRRITY